MIIKVKITSISDEKLENARMDDYLSIGEIYEVFGISVIKGKILFIILIGEHLIKVISELFEVVDSKIPPLLHLKVWKNGDVTLWPKLFYTDFFFDKYSEREFVERKEFDEIKKMMY